MSKNERPMLMVCRNREQKPRYVSRMDFAELTAGMQASLNNQYPCWWLVKADSAHRARLTIAALKRGVTKPEMLAKGGYRKERTAAAKEHAKALKVKREANRDAAFLRLPGDQKMMSIQTMLGEIRMGREHVSKSLWKTFGEAGALAAWAGLTQNQTEKLLENLLARRLSQRDLYTQVMYNRRYAFTLANWDWRKCN